MKTMKPRMYLLFLTGGVEIGVEGPYENNDARTNEARKHWNTDARPDHCDNVFELNIDENGNPSVAAYMDGSLEPEVR